MVETINFDMRESFRNLFSEHSFDRKNLVSVGLVVLGLLLATGFVYAQSSPDVELGTNGIVLNTGSLDLNLNDLTGVSSVKDGGGDEVLSVNDSQNSVEATGGFRLPTGTDAYN